MSFGLNHMFNDEVRFLWAWLARVTCCLIWKEADFFSSWSYFNYCLWKASIVLAKIHVLMEYFCVELIHYSVSWLFQIRFLPALVQWKCVLCNLKKKNKQTQITKNELWIRLLWRKHIADPETPNQDASRKVFKNVSDTRNVFGNIFILYVFFFLKCFIIHILWTAHWTWLRSSPSGTLVSSDLLKWS